jgi:hypothetical protein
LLRALSLVIRRATGSHKDVGFARDSLLEESGFEPVWGFSCQVVILVCSRFFVAHNPSLIEDNDHTEANEAAAAKKSDAKVANPCVSDRRPRTPRGGLI